jgi:hypothetical protein
LLSDLKGALLQLVHVGLSLLRSHLTHAQLLLRRELNLLLLLLLLLLHAHAFELFRIWCGPSPSCP